MRGWLMLIANASLALAAPALAEPAKAPDQQADRAPRPAAVVLASAEQVRAPGADQQPQQPVKRARVARVTSCRCGDPQSGSAEQQ